MKTQQNAVGTALTVSLEHLEFVQVIATVSLVYRY